MERMRGGLKRAFFFYTLWCVLGALVLVAAVFLVCSAAREELPSGGIMVEMGGQVITMEVPDERERLLLHVLDGVQLAAWVTFPLGGLALADLLFYRKRLKGPIAALTEGAERIGRRDLDFVLDVHAEDELGKLCEAFESMRAALLESNRRLWSRIEERRRLNAAFAHDLRNPITVLKGAARMLEREDLSPEQRAETVSLMGRYTGRLETYVEAMTRAQKLEEISCTPRETAWEALGRDLERSAALLCANAGKELSFTQEGTGTVFADVGLIQRTAENLVDNALRYAAARVAVELRQEEGSAILMVSDDGPGFPEHILKRGPAPFLHAEGESGEHFGMGLYLSRLSCERHGGALSLSNSRTGAQVTAIFHI